MTTGRTRPGAARAAADHTVGPARAPADHTVGAVDHAVDPARAVTVVTTVASAPRPTPQHRKGGRVLTAQT